jgi:hypothetical protein
MDIKSIFQFIAMGFAVLVAIFCVYATETSNKNRRKRDFESSKKDEIFCEEMR